LRKEPERSRDAKEIINLRVKGGIRSISAYSVPEIKCPVKLDGNESPFALPEEVLSEVRSSLKDIPFNRYPDPEARALKSKIAKAFKVPDTGKILLGNGSDELISIIMTTFSGGSGKVLYPVPTFSMFGIMARVLGLEVIEVPLDSKFDIDLDETLGCIEREDPDLIFLASPNNPTGNCFSTSKIAQVIESSKGIVVVDEAYSDFSGTTLLDRIDDYPNLLILKTLSKVGYAALRLGILFGCKELVGEMNKVRLPYNINSFTQRFAEIILERPYLIAEAAEKIAMERQRVYDALSSTRGIKVFPSDANFHLIRVGDADKVFSGLAQRGILIRNLSSQGVLDGCLRVTVGTPEENDKFLAALSEIALSEE
jgi:histidinol-phosphate aminotransferase